MRLWKITRFGTLIDEVIASSAYKARVQVAFYHNLPRAQLVAVAAEED